MEFTNQIIKKGISLIGDYQVEYDIVFKNEQPLRFLAKFYKGVEKTPVGSATYKTVKQNVIIGFTDSDVIVSADRIAIYEDLENTIQKLFI